MNELLFIGGAPRTGTTLLANLLDGHPQILVFPTEHSTIERYFWNRERIEQYARNEFISQRREGQQTLLANREFLEIKRQQAFDEFQKDFSLDIDCESFRRAYIKYLEGQQATLESILFALIHGLRQANAFAGSYQLVSRTWLCFKQPFYTELFARSVAEILEHCRFIHLIRNPYSRYLSAKERRKKQASLRGRRLGHINRFSYAKGHMLIDAASRLLAEENRESIGSARYYVLEFEELVSSPECTVTRLLDWLGVRHAGFSVVPTRLGEPADSASSLTKGFAVDPSAVHRNGQYQANTSWNERLIHQTIFPDTSHGRSTSFARSIGAFLSPLPDSDWRNYLCQLSDLVGWMTGDVKVQTKKFVAKARSGQVRVSGAT